MAPIPVYGQLLTQPHDLEVGEVVVAATCDPWEKRYRDYRAEVVVGRPTARILTNRAAYLWNGREARTLLKFWAYPRRIICRIDEFQEAAV